MLTQAVRMASGDARPNGQSGYELPGVGMIATKRSAAPPGRMIFEERFRCPSGTSRKKESLPYGRLSWELLRRRD